MPGHCWLVSNPGYCSSPPFPLICIRPGRLSPNMDQLRLSIFKHQNHAWSGWGGWWVGFQNCDIAAWETKPTNIWLQSAIQHIITIVKHVSCPPLRFGMFVCCGRAPLLRYVAVRLSLTVCVIVVVLVAPITSSNLYIYIYIYIWHTCSGATRPDNSWLHKP